MSLVVDVVVERESANDADGTVVEIFVASGLAVTAGERLFDIETSKAVQEIYAPATGILVHVLSKGDTIPLGGAVGQILPEGAPAPAPAPAMALTAVRTPAVIPRQSLPRLSREATALAAQYSLVAADFDRDLVTT